MGENLSWLNEPLQTWFAAAGSRLRPHPLPPNLDCRGCSKSLQTSDAVESERWRKWKCCTFQPFVANFLLGAMLEEREIPKAEKTVLSPLGLCPSMDYRTKFLATEDEKRGQDLTCAFFDDRKRACTVWKNRPSECSVYYCQETPFFRQRSGDLFDWEMAVAQMALAEHGFSHREIEILVNALEGDLSDPAQHWKHWADEPESFLRSCWQWARERTGQEIYSWLPPDVKARFDTWVRFA